MTAPNQQALVDNPDAPAPPPLPDALPPRWAFFSRTIAGILVAGICIVLTRIGLPGLDAYVREIVTNSADVVAMLSLGAALHGRTRPQSARRLYWLPRRRTA